MYKDNSRVQIFFLMLYFAWVLGIVAGAILYSKSQTQPKINEEMLLTAKTLANMPDKWHIAKNLFIENVICGCIIFFASFFRLGIAAGLAAIMRYGFITGFCGAASIGAFGIKGELAMSAFIIDIPITALTFIVLGTVSAAIAYDHERKNKKILFFLLIFSISIFCVAAVLRGYLATTFMGLIYPKIA